MVNIECYYFYSVPVPKVSHTNQPSKNDPTKNDSSNDTPKSNDGHGGDENA